ncbi:hypothetical protein BAUCODRAFT_149002 [Baudoinia panamericana UAMH 10762]|uniref:Uncharacterized protein n=1 Tax=Baudoinia panamericana (strain UAMH 10762) TaxID=717646 RepID=M2MEG1_BAUPA|nr:uncharacterized protein BAUCODRAFT_149002 [Baudoinia panamericana UAMH 10762]EMC94961.1 hypothetical protein BAUCODRAFT_149002 [Baudoinia panamericana UAMH 10762]
MSRRTIDINMESSEFPDRPPPSPRLPNMPCSMGGDPSSEAAEMDIEEGEVIEVTPRFSDLPQSPTTTPRQPVGLPSQFDGPLSTTTFGRPSLPASEYEGSSWHIRSECATSSPARTAESEAVNAPARRLSQSTLDVLASTARSVVRPSTEVPHESGDACLIALPSISSSRSRSLEDSPGASPVASSAPLVFRSRSSSLSSDCLGRHPRHGITTYADVPKETGLLVPDETQLRPGRAERERTPH